MHKLLITFFIIALTITETLAYAIKVYDENGNRIGTYRKEGQGYQFYDSKNNKAANAGNFAQNAAKQPNQIVYPNTFYSGNMTPVGRMSRGYNANHAKNYIRNSEFVPSAWAGVGVPNVTSRPAMNKHLSGHMPYRPRTVFVDSRYPKMHNF